ncbi:MAG: hypothetical protein Q9202_005356 [Teloschistes flavicans]
MASRISMIVTGSRRRKDKEVGRTYEPEAKVTSGAKLRFGARSAEAICCNLVSSVVDPIKELNKEQCLYDDDQRFDV